MSDNPTLDQLLASLAELGESDTPDKEALMSLHRQLSDVYAQQNKFGKAAEHLEAILLCLKEQNDNELQQAEIYHELAWLYSRTLETERAIECSQTALELFAEKEAEPHYAKTYRRLGALYIENGDNKQGFECLELALEWGNATQDTKIVGDTYRTMGEIYAYLQQYKASNTAYLNAISCYETIKDNQLMAVCHQAIGRALVQNGNHAHAIEQYNRANNCLSRDDNAAEDRGFNFILLAKIYEAKSNYPAAIDHYGLAAQNFEQSGNGFEQVNAGIQIAALCEETKKWQNALDVYQNLLPYAQNVDDEMQTATITEGIKHCQKMLEKLMEKNSNPKTQESTGIFGKFKKIFGG